MDIRFVLPAGDERITRLVRFLYGRQFRVVRVCGAILLVAVAALVVTMAFAGVTATDVVVLVGAIVIAVAALGYPAWAERHIRRTQPWAAQSWQYRLGDDGVEITGAPATQYFAWDGIQRAHETPDDVYLLVGRYLAVQLPKHLLGAADLVELRAFLAGRGLSVGSR
ncbi:YcxB family protein [Actinocatenispora sera]|uniref:YcxB-like C-terminal domain-containing protein n=1 Tax=Actinocatenispora sera TaxID=390989 RepID=A0A810L662_9ACTN|nr:YcxB family protein [Actinocatenispora sera]BCJ31050.1 hypothetical protein Asera_51580 [Actinocatenispora sera]